MCIKCSKKRGVTSEMDSNLNNTSPKACTCKIGKSMVESQDSWSDEEGEDIIDFNLRRKRLVL